MKKETMYYELADPAKSYRFIFSHGMQDGWWNYPKDPVFRGWKCCHAHFWMQILYPSTSAKPVMTKLQNLFVALVNMDTFNMTLKLSVFCVCRHAEYLLTYAYVVSAPFGLLIKFRELSFTFWKLKSTYGTAPNPWY